MKRSAYSLYPSQIAKRYIILPYIVMRCSIVILNWNGEEMLRKFLPSVIKYCPLDSEVIVADNGSTDNSIALLHSDFPTVRIIELQQNYGFAEGYNKALAEIDTEYCVLLNSDVEVTENWLTPLLDYLAGSPETAALQPKILAYYDKSRFEHAGAAGGFIDKLGYPYCRGRIMNTIEEDHGQYDSECDIFWASGACFVVRTKIFKEVGGFDSTFFAHMEEIDLCWRLHSNRYKVKCLPQSTIYHLGGGALPYESPNKTFLNFRNSLLMLYKNLPISRRLWLFPLRFLLDYIASLQYLLKGKPKHAAAVIKARIAYHKLKRRSKVVNSNCESALRIAKVTYSQPKNHTIPLSILFHYYILRHRKFSDFGQSSRKSGQSPKVESIVLFTLLAFFTLAPTQNLYSNSPYISKVYEFMPAPGQFTNVMPPYEAGDNAEAMLAKVNEKICEGKNEIVCLGGWGGYVVFGFDHTIINLPDSCDFEVLGNAFYSKINETGRQQGSAEPAVIYVSRDANANGIPDDEWFEIKGSEYSRSRLNYSCTYFRPSSDTLNVTATDIDGNTITIYRNTFHTQPYYPQWLGEQYTLTGTLLPSNVLQDDNFSWLVFDYGYADNHPNGNPKGFIDIDWAVDANGNFIHLSGIDFVKVQTGVSADSGLKGETSAEIAGARDLHPNAGENPIISPKATQTNQCITTIRNGQLLIIKNGITYNVQGMMINDK